MYTPLWAYKPGMKIFATPFAKYEVA